MNWKNVLIALSCLCFLGVAGPTAAETADDVVCDMCVNTYDIASRAVGPRTLKNGAVTNIKLNDGAVDWQKLATELQERIIQLETRLAAVEQATSDTEDLLESSTVLKLDGYLDLDATDLAKPTAVFAGVNVRVVNGDGQTDTINGLGNLIVGYDEAGTESDYSPVCSVGSWITQAECEDKGGVWALNHKSGSHNIVVGPANRYSQTGGLVAGYANTANGPNSTVVGGRGNLASGEHSTVSGGYGNHARAMDAAVTGGYANVASGTGSSVSGGHDNTASGDYASVSGGFDNTASWFYSSIGGGRLNIAGGYYSSVSGGRDRAAEGSDDWAAGQVWQDH